MNSVIHGAIRRDLGRFDRALDTFTDGNRARAAELALAWDFFHRQIERHHTDEETLFWPAIQQVAPNDVLMAELEGEHKTMLAALEESSAAMAALRDDPSAANAARARGAMSGLAETLTTHFAHEERELEPVFVDHVQSAPLQAAQQAVRKTQPGTQGGQFFAWLRDQQSDADKAVLTRLVPAPVLFVLSRVVGRGYQKNIAPVWTR
jgi:hemerythrin-like domain-containing protein